jgi:hypothetical protein
MSGEVDALILKAETVGAGTRMIEVLQEKRWAS